MSEISLSSALKSFSFVLRDQIRLELQVQPHIDPALWLEKRLNFLVEYLRHSSAKGLVLGISGGQDSTLAGKLYQLAAERVRNLGLECQFLAVRLPYGVQSDEADAQISLEFIRPDRVVSVNIKPMTDGISSSHVRFRDFLNLTATNGSRAKKFLSAKWKISSFARISKTYLGGT